jgi:hypothetical protein
MILELNKTRQEVRLEARGLFLVPTAARAVNGQGRNRILKSQTAAPGIKQPKKYRGIKLHAARGIKISAALRAESKVTDRPKVTSLRFSALSTAQL